MKSHFYLLYLGILLISCRKESNDGLLGLYRTEQIASVSAPVMYVNNAVITDTALINTYLRHHNYLHHFTYSSTLAMPDSLFIIDFLNNGAVRYMSRNSSNYLQGKKVKLSAVEIGVQGIDTSTFIIYQYPPPRVRCDTLNTLISKYKALEFITVQGPSALVKYVFRQPLSYKNGELFFHAGTYFIMSHPVYQNPPGCTIMTGLRGIIKADHIEASLLPADTIVYQEKKIRMVK